MRRVRAERDRFVGFVLETVESWPESLRLRGEARFIDAHHLQAGEHTRMRAARIVIATGSSPYVPPGWRETLGERLLLSDQVFDWQTLPVSVAVAGTGWSVWSSRRPCTAWE